MNTQEQHWNEYFKELKAAPKYKVWPGWETEQPCDRCGKKGEWGVNNVISYPYDDVEQWEDDHASAGIICLGGGCLKIVMKEMKDIKDEK